MADLEELALRRDRGYLVRLVLVLALGAVLAVALLRVMTGDRAKGCAADAVVGGRDAAPGDQGDARH